MDYGPALPPRLGTNPSRHVNDASDQPLDTAEEPSRLPLTKVKKPSHSHKQHVIDPSSATDQYSDQTEDPRPASNRPKSMLTKLKVNTNPDSDISHLLQRRISPLYPDTGQMYFIIVLCICSLNSTTY